MEGLTHFSLNIAEVLIRVRSDAPDMDFAVKGALGRFLADGGKPDVEVRVDWDDLSKRKEGRRIFDSGALWQAYRDEEETLFRLTSPMLGATPYMEARFGADFTSGTIGAHRPYFDRRQSFYPLEYPLDELLVTHYLSDGMGVEVHACGLVDPHGEGLLFVGPSGAGKTTMARLWQNRPGVIVLSDDRIILRKLDDRVWMYGTPWHGEAEHASPEKAILTRLFFLTRGPANELVPQGKPDSVARLFGCSFLPFYDPSCIKGVLKVCDEIGRTTPCHELRFTPDGAVVEFLF